MSADLLGVALMLFGVGAAAIIGLVQGLKRWSRAALLIVAFSAFVSGAWILSWPSLAEIDFTSIRFVWLIAGVVVWAALVVLISEVRRRRTAHQRREVAARLEERRREADAQSEALRGEVAARLRAYCEMLDELYEQLQCELPDEPLRRADVVKEKANQLLKYWKQKCMEYLDTFIEYREAMRFYELGSRLLRRAPTPGAHVTSSYEAHRDFLKKRASEVEQGRVRIKEPPGPSGEPLPIVEDFVISPQALRLARP